MQGQELLMNIAGAEWIVLVLLGLVLLFGTNRLPQFSRGMGKAVGEFEKARNMFRREIQEAIEPAASRTNVPKITGPVASEREKLEVIATSLGIDDCSNLADEQLRVLISKRLTN